MASSLRVGRHRNPLFELSCTCRALRRFCVPRIFRFVDLNLTPPAASVLPVISNTRGVFFGHRGLDQPRLSAFLGTAEKLRDAYFDSVVTCLPAMLRLPALDHLSVSNAAWASIRTSFPVPKALAPLRVLRLFTKDRVEMLAHQSLDLSLEAEWIAELCPQLRTHLEVLALPAESVRVSLITASPWPHLRELFLYGCCPILDAPLLQMFDMLPKLRAFILAVAVARGQAPLILCPRNSRRSPDISGLRRLTLASTSPKDGIFVHVPPELEELSLRDVPRFYTRSPWGRTPLDQAYGTHVLSCGDVLSIFRTMPRLAALNHLELVVIEDEHELDLLAYIAGSCSQLASFEFHCYRNVSEYDDLVSAPLAVPLDALGKALATFPSLRVVRLNIDLPWSEFTISQYYDRGFGDGSTYAQTIAQTIARAVPWLDAVCVLVRDASNLYRWNMWTVDERCGDVQLTAFERLRGVQYKQTSDI
ncbi:hypothetical protein AURDEDRAFT_116719 [Auricularia subglabra TFB-10046 SS5]|uniref:F-box domain-containing protein n=1 Tax=Auricularia subglabra (strain TFB-10046 / SS5) TaxID=717982 RepID=J0DAU6_AURST|nr:hypothetical protein AURDEDRAFT_116719 [Auricularia subglabra TFB-10046 SS5]